MEPMPCLYTVNCTMEPMPSPWNPYLYLSSLYNFCSCPSAYHIGKGPSPPLLTAVFLCHPWKASFPFLRLAWLDQQAPRDGLSTLFCPPIPSLPLPTSGDSKVVFINVVNAWPVRVEVIKKKIKKKRLLMDCRLLGRTLQLHGSAIQHKRKSIRCRLFVGNVD